MAESNSIPQGGNPYPDWFPTLMLANDAAFRLDRHWSVRAEFLVHRVGCCLERARMQACSSGWVRATGPILEWLGKCQAKSIVARCERLQAAWEAQNGPTPARAGGMGGVPPMLTRSKPARGSVRGQGAGLSGSGSRPEKPAVR